MRLLPQTWNNAAQTPARIASGTVTEAAVLADLFELARGERSGRAAGDAASITLFKSVGAALEDLAAAELAVEMAAGATAR